MKILFSGILDLLRAGVPFAPHLIIPEPTGNVPMAGSKGLMQVVLRFRGVSVHSSVPVEGKNSNKNAAVFITRMLDFERELKEERAELFEVPYTTMNVGILRGGNASNTTPDGTFVDIDFRICDSENQHSRIIEAIEKNLEGLDGEYEIILDIPSFENRGDLVPVYEELSGNKASAFTGVSDASYLKGDRIILGPGPMTAHETNEHVSVESLAFSKKLYREMIQKLCS